MRDDLHRHSLVVDAHAHGLGFVPEPARSLYRLLNRRTMPPDLGFDALAPAGVDAVVAKAVGDPIVTGWYRGGPWAAVQAQLDRLERQAADADGLVVDDAGGVRRARELGTFAVILGL